MTQLEFDQIFRTYFGALCHYAQTIVGSYAVAQDVVEEMFIRVWQRRKASIDNVQGFLYKATRNACLDYMRSLASRFSAAGEPSENAMLSEHPEHEMLKTEVYRQLLNAIDQLPEQCGKIITLSYLEGLPSKVIGAQMNITTSTVDNQKARGLERLRKLLSKDAFRLLLSVLMS